MSFFLTTPQILAGKKTVTRRMGWGWLKPGTVIQAIEKGQGLKKGEKVKRLAMIRVLSVTRERLDQIDDHGPEEATREGFPKLGNDGFVAMFRQHHRINADAIVTRIEFEYYGRKAVKR